jgi:hypothetical protein
MSTPRYSAAPVYDVNDTGNGRHERVLVGWDVVDDDGIYTEGPFDTEPEAMDAAKALQTLAAGRAS